MLLGIYRDENISILRMTRAEEVGAVQSELVKKARAGLFDSRRMNLIVYNFAQEVALPESSGVLTARIFRKPSVLNFNGFRFAGSARARWATIIFP
jgi:hypothetical protein